MSQVITASFNGIPCAAEFSLVLGASSGTGTIEFPSTSVNLPYRGTLVMSDGINTVQLSSLYVDKPRIEADGIGGTKLSATIHDKRFAWQWGFIIGIYNQPDYYNAPTQGSSLSDLIQLCLIALGENNAVLTNIPTSYPPVKWEPENPASALEDLCDEAGLVIGIDTGIASNPIVICPYDYDRQLPLFLRTSAIEGVSSAIKPARIYFFGGRSVLQRDFDLIPVGEDTDGSIVPIADLSYAPADWGDSLREMYTNLSTQTQRELADKCVFKWYSIDWSVHAISKVLPLLTEVVDTIVESGTLKREKPYVTGTKTNWDGVSFKINSATKISEGFSVDKKLGIVKFNELLVTPKNEDYASGGFDAPTLTLTAAYHLKTNTLADFYYKYVSVPGGTELPVFYEDSDVVLMYKRIGTATIATNEENLTPHVNSILESIKQYYISRFPKIYSYPGIFPIGAWGSIRNVVWRADPSGGAITEVHKDLEIPKPMLPDYTDREMRRKFRILWKTRKDTKDIKKLWPFE